MRLLVDTNIFLEVILAQERSQEAQSLLSRVQEHEFFISDYSLHSIGILLLRRKRGEIFWQFVTDMILDAGVQPVGLSALEMLDVINAAQRFHLDFDDAYQYTVARRYNLVIVSFDADFDRTDTGRKTPNEVTIAT